MVVDSTQRISAASANIFAVYGVTLNKARALYLVRVSELHVKSMYKIDRWGKGGGQKIVY